jgi:hypothetical protein
MTIERAIAHLADLETRGYSKILLPARVKELEAKFAESARMGLTLTVTGIARPDRTHSIQFAEGISPAVHKGDA